MTNNKLLVLGLLFVGAFSIRSLADEPDDSLDLDSAAANYFYPSDGVCPIYDPEDPDCLETYPSYGYGGYGRYDGGYGGYSGYGYYGKRHRKHHGHNRHHRGDRDGRRDHRHRGR